MVIASGCQKEPRLISFSPSSLSQSFGIALLWISGSQTPLSDSAIATTSLSTSFSPLTKKQLNIQPLYGLFKATERKRVKKKMHFFL